MSSANEKTESILIVIKRCLKWIAISVAVLAGAIFLLVQYSYLSFEINEKKKYTEEAKVEVVVNAVSPEGKDCQKEGYPPYSYTVVNNTKETVSKVTFNVEVKRKGFSRVLDNTTEITEYKILKPNESYEECFYPFSYLDIHFWSYNFSEPLTENDVEIYIVAKSVEFENEQSPAGR